ncbi:MAG: amidohydrolase family protein [Actinomycetota bacterium]|nr:amidohydrolase family protein [Actinomycetota bacterium]
MQIVDARMVTDDGVGAFTIDIEGSRIVRVSRLAHRTGIGTGGTIDACGRYVLPGMINAHAHLSLQGKLLGQDRDAYYDIYRDEAANQAVNSVIAGLQSLGHGVTTVRDAGSSWYVSLAARDAFRSGKLIGPRIFSCGKVLSVPFQGLDVKPPGMTVDVSGPEQIEKAIADLVEVRMVDFIKLKGHRRNFVNEDETALFSAEDIAFAGHEAHRRGKRFAVHAWHNQVVEAALEAGVADSVEHGNCLSVRPDLLTRMRQSGTIYIPNLTSWAPSRVANEAANKRAGIRLERVWDAVECAIAEGVEIAAGTDLYCPALPVELGAFLQLGMSHEDVLKTVTTSAARLLGLDTDLGRVESGYVADLILIDRHPFEDLAALSAPNTVIIDGCVVSGQDVRALSNSAPADALLASVNRRRL